ncbi:hypothetical protein BKA70DRAFT_1246560, partial [Coprinopsis sp. MPI-PUGE-AT-0042]
PFTFSSIQPSHAAHLIARSCVITNSYISVQSQLCIHFLKTSSLRYFRLAREQWRTARTQRVKGKALRSSLAMTERENQMPDAVMGAYGPQSSRHTRWPPASLNTCRSMNDGAINGACGWVSQTESLMIPSPFSMSNAPTPENVQEHPSLKGLDGPYGYCQQRYVPSLSNVHSEAPVPPIPIGGESDIDWQVYSWDDMSAFASGVDSLANFNPADVTYNEPEGFEGSAEISTQP